MSKQLRTLGIVLSLGAAGCAGFGVQHASSLPGQFQGQQGLDNLWNASEADPKEGLEVRAYGEPGLSGLWDQQPAEPTSSEGGSRLYEQRGLGDLWYPASVSRSWEVGGERATPSRGMRLRGSARRKQAGRSQVAAR
jgi:hypothetical protein